jgi:hypothetical protein
MVFQTFLQRKDQNFVGLFIWFAVLIWGISYFISPCVAWWRRRTLQQAASPLRLYLIYTSYLHITMRCMVETPYAAAGCFSTASLLDFILHITMRCMVET